MSVYFVAVVVPYEKAGASIVPSMKGKVANAPKLAPRIFFGLTYHISGTYTLSATLVGSPGYGPTVAPSWSFRVSVL